jgi:arginase
LGLFTGIPVHTIEQAKNRETYTDLIENCKFIDAIYTHLNNATEKILETLRFDKFPFIFSGDHSNATAAIASLRAKYPKSRIGVIWIDAHADLHTPYTTPSGNMHGMPVAMSLSEDNINKSKHQLIGEGFTYWEKIKDLGVQGRANLSYQDIMFIDIRNLEAEEWDLIHDNRVVYTTPETRKEQGIEHIINLAKTFSASFDYIYLSFDIDSLDESLVPGTGTRVENGLSLKEAGQLLHQLYQLPNLAAFEITEINPKLDIDNTTLKNVYEVIKDMARVS